DLGTRGEHRLRCPSAPRAWRDLATVPTATTSASEQSCLFQNGRIDSGAQMSLKDAYVSKMEAQLKEWEAELSKLKARAQKAAAEGRVEYQKRIEGLQPKYQAAVQKLEELKRAGEDRWEAMKSGVESAWSELRASAPPKDPSAPPKS